MVVLDQDGVVQPHPMVACAANADRVFFEHTQRRRRLSRVEHLDPARRPFHVHPDQRRNAGESLEEVERRPLADEQRPHGREHLGDHVARVASFAVTASRDAANAGLELPERFACDIETGHHAWLPGDERAAAVRAARHNRSRGDIAGPDILGEGAPDDLFVQRAIERRDHRPCGAS